MHFPEKKELSMQLCSFQSFVNGTNIFGYVVKSSWTINLSIHKNQVNLFLPVFVSLWNSRLSIMCVVLDLNQIFFRKKALRQNCLQKVYALSRLKLIFCSSNLRQIHVKLTSVLSNPYMLGVKLINFLWPISVHLTKFKVYCQLNRVWRYALAADKETKPEKFKLKRSKS